MINGCFFAEQKSACGKPVTRIIGWRSHKVWFGLQDTKYKSRIPKYKSRTSNTSPGHKIQVLDLELHVKND